MSRTSKYKITYFLYVGCGALLVAWLIFAYRFSPVAVLGLIAVLLLPGRILGLFWRDLLRGLRLLRSKQFAESKRHSELFLEKVRRQPWLKKLIWLGHGTYSRDPEALALNNLGAAEIAMGEPESARLHLEASIDVDSGNPLPYFNLGVLELTLDDVEQAEVWFQRAAAYGYSRSVIDRLITAAQARFAFTDGQGQA